MCCFFFYIFCLQGMLLPQHKSVSNLDQCTVLHKYEAVTACRHATLFQHRNDVVRSYDIVRLCIDVDTTWCVQGVRGVLENRCSEICSQNPLKITLKMFMFSKVTGYELRFSRILPLVASVNTEQRVILVLVSLFSVV